MYIKHRKFKMYAVCQSSKMEVQINDTESDLSGVDDVSILQTVCLSAEMSGIIPD